MNGERTQPKEELIEVDLITAWDEIVRFYSPDSKEVPGQLRPHNYRQLQERFGRVRKDHEFRNYICSAYQQRLWSRDRETSKEANDLMGQLLTMELPEDFDFDLVRDTLASLLPTQG